MNRLHRACNPEPFVTGGFAARRETLSETRRELYLHASDVECLDAPEMIPTGSLVAMRLGYAPAKVIDRFWVRP